MGIEAWNQWSWVCPLRVKPGPFIFTEVDVWYMPALSYLESVLDSWTTTHTIFILLCIPQNPHSMWFFLMQWFFHLFKKNKIHTPQCGFVILCRHQCSYDISVMLLLSWHASQIIITQGPSSIWVIMVGIIKKS